MKRRQILGLCAAAVLVAGSAASAASKVTIQYVTWAVKEEIDELRNNIVPQFEAAHPSIKVKVVQIPYGEYFAKLLSQMAAGVAPDLLTMEPGTTNYFVPRNLLADLSPFAKRSRFKPDAFVDAVADKVLWNGRFLWMPVHLVANAMYYNETLYKQGGAPPPTRDWTWDDFLSRARKLTKDTNGDGKPDVYGYMSGSWEAQYGPFLWGAGGSILDKQVAGTKAVVASPEAIEAFTFLKDLKFRYGVMTAYAGGVFEKSKVAMTNDGSWMVPAFRNARGLEFDVTTLPRNPRTGKAATRIAPAYVSVWAGSKHKAESWEFLRFMVSDYSQKRKHISALFAPLMKEQVNWPEFYPTNLQPKSARSVFLDLLKVGYTDTAYPNDRFAPIESKYLPALLENKTDVTTALTAMARDMNALFKTLPRR